MSVQLIVYPQSFEGFGTSNNANYIVDGINFSTVNDSTNTLVASSSSAQAIITLNPIMAVNTWYRYHSGITSFEGAVIEQSSNLQISADSSSYYNGIVQKLSGLIVGAVYTVTVKSKTITNKTAVEIYSGTTNIISTSFPDNSLGAVDTLQFTANSTEDTLLMLASYNGINSNFIIDDISIAPAVNINPQDGQVICDLYEDEDLPLTLSVDEFKNVAEKVQSYSKAFNLPATKRNNLIFDNIFEITRADDGIIFNPYKSTICVLKQDGFIIFQGFLRLLDVTDKEGEISYNVNLYSEVIALAEVLKDRTINNLSFEELDHDYNFVNIKNSWTGGLLLNVGLPLSSFANNTGVDNATTTNVLKYPFVDWAHNYELTDTNQPKLPNLESAFRPFINVKYLINRMFAATDFTFKSDFFDTIDFQKLFIDFNWGSSNNGASILTTGGFRQSYNTSSEDYFFNEWWTAFKLQDNTAGTNTGWNNTSYLYTSSVNNLEVTVDYYLRCTNTSIFSRGNALRVAKFNADNVLLEVFHFNNADIGGNSGKTIQGTFSTVMQIGDYIRGQGSAPSDDIRISESSPMSYMEFSFNTTGAQVVPLLTQLRGELNQWDLLKALINMFNLVTMPDEENPNNIIIEPYSDIFINNADKPLNWTDKIDVSQMKLEPLINLNRTTEFKFAEDGDDFPFNQYKNLFNGKLYGSYTFPETPNQNFSILEGVKEISAEPFAATVVKPLMPTFPELIIPQLYSYDIDEDTTEGFDNSPRIMFDSGIKDLVSMTYDVPAQNGGDAVPLEHIFLQFSHLTSTPTIQSSRDFHFGVCQLMPEVGAGTVNNLFNLYWKPYFDELYNADTRIMTIKVDLNASDINRFKFNSKVYIKNRIFRVNKIDYKPNDLSTVEFILIP